MAGYGAPSHKERGTRVSPGAPNPPYELPHGYGADHGERHGDEPKVNPGSVTFRVLGQHEKVNDDPYADEQSEHQPDEVARGLVGRPYGLALRAAHSDSHDNQRGDEDRTKQH